MKKILFVINQLYKGGAETALVNLVNQVQDEYEIELVVFNQLKNSKAISLIDSISKKIKVYDIREIAMSMSKMRTYFDYEKFSKEVMSTVVKDKHFSCAISYGEWFSPEFVAKYVDSDLKVAWIHSDLDKNSMFDAANYFFYDQFIDYYLFVSKKSMESSVEKYSFLKNKTFIVHNICDDNSIVEQSKEVVDDIDLSRNRYKLLCVGNIRKEKNYSRCIEVATILKEKGFNFDWYFVGSKSDGFLVKELTSQINAASLNDSIHMIGSRENPHKYMKNADLVLSLSDFESWSLIITEAKLLNCAIMATPTSGALEQIQHKHNGIITSFNSYDIANDIISLFSDKVLYESIKKNNNGFSTINLTKQEFSELIEKNSNHFNELKRNLLYIIDDINYGGGAHKATLRQIEYLSSKIDVHILSKTKPGVNVRNQLENVEFHTYESFDNYEKINERVLPFMFGRHTLKDKLWRLKFCFFILFKGYFYAVDKLFLTQHDSFYEQFERVCVMSEASVFRKAVSLAKKPMKIQWIHTDYSVWRNLTWWTKSVTSTDLEMYKEYDKIVLLSEVLKEKFVDIFPELRDKVYVSKNVMDMDKIKELGHKQSEEAVKFITVGRVEDEKQHSIMADVFSKLALEGYEFEWTVVGDGSLLIDLKKQVMLDNNLCPRVKFTGNLKNPFSVLAKNDCFVLFSKYEGVPNTIYESFVLGVPVIASDVGAISDQIKEHYGLLIKNNTDELYNALRKVMDNPEIIKKWKENLKDYTYDNKLICDQNDEIFELF